MAIVTGVSVNYLIEGNDHPVSLVGGRCKELSALTLFQLKRVPIIGLPGVLAIFGAIFITFLSRQQFPESSGDASAHAKLKPRALGQRGVLSFGKLTDAMEIHLSLDAAATSDGERRHGEGGGGNGRFGERSALAQTKDPPGYSAVATGVEALADQEGEDVLLGLVLSAAAGCIDGFWSSLTLAAKRGGVDNYVSASYFCAGLLVPLVVLETATYLRDPITWKNNVKKVMLSEWALVALSGFLNIFAVSRHLSKIRLTIARLSWQTNLTLRIGVLVDHHILYCHRCHLLCGCLRNFPLNAAGFYCAWRVCSPGARWRADEQEADRYRHHRALYRGYLLTRVKCPHEIMATCAAERPSLCCHQSFVGRLGETLCYVLRAVYFAYSFLFSF